MAMAGRGWMYAKMAGVFLGCCIGGPALMYYVTPSEGEVFKRFNPDLQARNLAMREQRIKDNEEFSRKMIEYAKSDKPVWVVAAEAEKKEREEWVRKERMGEGEKLKMREEMRRAQVEGR